MATASQTVPTDGYSSNAQKVLLVNSSGTGYSNGILSDFDHFSKAVSTSATQLTSSTTSLSIGMLIKAKSINAGKVYIGKSDVTDADTAATDGYELLPGDEVFIPITNPSLVYGISDSGTNTVFVLLM